MVHRQGLSEMRSQRSDRWIRLGSALFFVWSILHLWVGAEGFRQFLGGVRGQWEMLIGGANASKQAFVHVADGLTGNVHAHLLINFTTDVAGYGVLGLFVAWDLWVNRSWRAYWVGLIVIGIADLAFLFSLVTPGIIELNAGTLGGPIIWALACVVTPLGLSHSKKEERL